MSGLSTHNGGPDWDAVEADLAAEAGVVIRQPFRCENPSKYAGWLLKDGTVVPARCGATNRCAYCAYQRVIEDALVVSMDAIRHGYPRVGMTLTARRPAAASGATTATTRGPPRNRRTASRFPVGSPTPTSM